MDAEVNDFYGGSILVYASTDSGPTTPALEDIKRQETEIYHLERMKLDPRNANNTGLPTNPIQYADMAMRHHPRSHLSLIHN